MTHPDGSAVDVDYLAANVQIAHRLDCDRRECLVELKQADAGGLETLPGQRLADGIGWLGEQRWNGSC